VTLKEGGFFRIAPLMRLGRAQTTHYQIPISSSPVSIWPMVWEVTVYANQAGGAHQASCVRSSKGVTRWSLRGEYVAYRSGFMRRDSHQRFASRDGAVPLQRQSLSRIVVTDSCQGGMVKAMRAPLCTHFAQGQTAHFPALEVHVIRMFVPIIIRIAVSRRNGFGQRERERWQGLKLEGCELPGTVARSSCISLTTGPKTLRPQPDGVQSRCYITTSL